MDLSQYIDVNDADGPKLVGHRIWLYDVLYEHVYNRRRADDLLERFPSLSMAEIYACLLHFELNRPACLVMLERERDRREQNYRAHAEQNRATYKRLIERLAERQEAG